MNLVIAGNVNGMLSDVLWRVKVNHTIVETRNGPAAQLRGPLIATYKHPWQRVLFSGKRDANPFFHLMESLWMLEGRNDVTFPAVFNSQFLKYSDDGISVHGAYGYRWREQFGIDQIEFVIRELYRDHSSRRAVIGMWDPMPDIDCIRHAGADVPCNLAVSFQVDPAGGLDMFVFNRANDVVWGLCGANAVHMSVLHEYVALSINQPQGKYHQMTANAHVYLNSQGSSLLDDPPNEDYYVADGRPNLPLFGPACRGDFDADLHRFMEDPFKEHVFETAFFDGVVAPMATAWICHKERDRAGEIAAVSQIQAWDWQMACGQWLTRRA